uniref:C-type lectin domain-containing protein n=1 Tax=Anolis carolinensis TaxID=28377 RepID=A0A803T0R1_ANOCA
MGLLTYASLCLFGLLLSSPFPGAVAASCARDWMQNQGNCYAYFDFKLTWAEAEIECQSYGRGAHLASVLTAAETALIANYISTYQKVKGNVWIGLHDPRQVSLGPALVFSEILIITLVIAFQALLKKNT